MYHGTGKQMELVQLTQMGTIRLYQLILQQEFSIVKYMERYTAATVGHG